VTPLTSVTALPSSGPVGGATTVTVTGTVFVASDLLYCKFGSAGRTHGTYVTSILLKCLSHSSATPGTVLLQVSNNNQDFASSLVEYLYYGMSGGFFVCAPGAHVRADFPSLDPLSVANGPARTLYISLVSLHELTLVRRRRYAGKPDGRRVPAAARAGLPL
jgi:hypothetical protein